jgi:hypothetical protein
MQGCGALGELCTRWFRIEYAPKLTTITLFTNAPLKGYELAEEEVRISLEDFKVQYSGVDGPEYDC